MSIRKGNDIIASKPLVDAVPTQDSTNAVSSGGAYDALATKQDTISDLATIRSGAAAGATAVQPSDLATVATTGNYNDLTNKPTIPAAQVNSDWDAVSGVAQILNKPSLATVATSGDYDDLINKPTLGTAAAANTTDFATAAQGALADTAVQPGDLATVATTGEFSDLQNKPTTLSGYGITDGANTDLSNLTSTGANIGNWSSNVTNCITEIPQDIKLELSNGTLTLKAGSKVYVPNGAGVFNAITIANDITFTITWGTNTQRFLFVKDNGTALEERQFSFSGSTAPTSKQYSVWYDTTNNTVKYTSNSGSTWSSNCSFPIAIIGNTNNVTTSIDQVFNGFGYVGSCVFTLPGVKGLYPNGRNQDGTLKSGGINCTSVQVSSQFNDTKNHVLMINPNGKYAWYDTNGFSYDPDTNIMYDSLGGVLSSAVLGTFTTTSGVISDFKPNTVFRAVDYSDTEYIAHQAMPSDRYVDLTLPTSGLPVTAPADGYIVLAKKSGAANEYISISGVVESLQTAYTTNETLLAWVPVSKGQAPKVFYNATGTTTYFKFVYANGAS